MAHARCRPTRPTVVLKENVDLIGSPEEVRSHWYRHFSKILSVPSEFREEVIADMPSQPTYWDLDGPAADEEFESALNKLKRGKAGGKMGILTELITNGGAELLDWMLELMQEVWEEQKVVADWKDAEIVPIPKISDF